ncbi:MAG: hypothetical protein AB7L90_14970 [Hyphomicrobiaceae bacterium]
MSKFSQWFVALVFVTLGLAFLASTASIVVEFRETELVTILAANSYLFIFFPTLGILALVAFYLPAVIFTDLYLNGSHWFLKLRFLLGAAIAIAASIWFADRLDQTPFRAVWEASPAALRADARQPLTCLNGKSQCVHPILPTLVHVRETAVDRSRLSPFARDCQRDTLTEPNPDNRNARYCFPARELLNAEQCCKVSEDFAKRLYRIWDNPATKSQAAQLDRYLLPFKCFFIIVLVAIGLLLVVWKRTLRARYSPWQRQMELGLQIGAVAMLAWPVMDYAYQLTTDVLFGQYMKLPLRLSLVTVPWVLLLTFHFKDRLKEDARFGQIVGTIASGVAFFVRGQDISDWSAKIVGVGGEVIVFAAIAMASYVGAIMLTRRLPAALRGEPATVQRVPEAVGPFT